MDEHAGDAELQHGQIADDSPRREPGSIELRFDERQIGLARMPRDRYVAMEADINVGTLMTKAALLKAKSMTVNANIVGHLKVRLLDDQGNALPDFNWVELSGDAIDLPVNWNGNLESLSDKPVTIEFQLQDAQLFGFDLNE